MSVLKTFVLEALWLFAAMAPWLLVGFLIAGIIAVCIPRSFVIRVMGGDLGFKSVLRSVLIGVPLPICSCGVIPISTALRKAGASKGAVAGFLISTPQTGIDSVLATYAVLGPFFAIARPIAAFLTGLAGGGIVHALSAPEEMRATDDSPCPQAQPQKGVRAVLWQGYVRILGGVVKPLLAGLAVSSVVSAAVPDGFFAEYLSGYEWLSLLLMAVVGFPMYVCSTAAIPIAASLVMKGLSPGAAFVFLMVGPAVNAVSIATVSSLIGRRATIAYTAVILAGAVFCGAMVDLLPEAVTTGAFCLGRPAGSGIGTLNALCAAVLAGLMLHALIRPPKMK